MYHKLLFSIALAASVSLIVPKAGPKVPVKRSFLMGFSVAPHERTRAGKIEAREFLNKYADVVAEDCAEGIPWEEAYRVEALPPEVEVSLRARRRKLKRKHLFLYVSALNLARNGHAPYWPKNKSQYEEIWADRGFGHPAMPEAYLNFCLELIRRFQPAYFAYASDVNYFASVKPAEWPAFLEFSRHVYNGIKKEYPDIPVFATFQASAYWRDPAAQEKVIREMLPYSDFMAVSAYPHLSGIADPVNLPAKFFARLAEIGSLKPFAIAETGFPHGGKEQDLQTRYLQFVLEESHKLDARFVVWFHSRDFGSIVDEKRIANAGDDVVELFSSRQYYGLVDDAGRKKKSHEVWKRWFQLPLVKSPQNES